MGHDTIACPDCGTNVSFTARKLKEIHRVQAKEGAGTLEKLSDRRHKSVECPQCEANIVIEYTKRGWLP